MTVSVPCGVEKLKANVSFRIDLGANQILQDCSCTCIHKNNFPFGLNDKLTLITDYAKKNTPSLQEIIQDYSKWQTHQTQNRAHWG